MDKRCKFCTHENLQDIDQALMAGAPFRELAAPSGKTPPILSRSILMTPFRITSPRYPLLCGYSATYKRSLSASTR